MIGYNVSNKYSERIRFFITGMVTEVIVVGKIYLDKMRIS